MLPSTEEELERAAEEMRLEWQLDRQDVPDVLTMLAKLKAAGRIANYERVPDDELPEDEAEYNPHTRIIRIRESTFRAANDLYRHSPHARASFTISHEIGHAVRKHDRIRHRNVSNRRIEQILIETRIDEAEANRFAGALLVPRGSVDMNANPTAAQLAERFQISEQAAAVRLAELSRMHRRANGIRRPLPQEVRRLLEDAKRRGHNIRSLDNE